MTDVFDPETRKRVMSSIRSKNSKAELIVFAYLRKNRVYFQKHYAKAPGKPDIALPRKKIAVFIDGDFWHGRNYEHRLKGRDRDDPWVKKIVRNIERDRSQINELVNLRWEMLRVWESDILRKRTQEATLKKIREYLIKPRSN
jgi:DNA mismatch endonuclease (patch repair protein)